MLVSVHFELVCWLNLFLNSLHLSFFSGDMLRGALYQSIVEVSSSAVKLAFSAVGTSESFANSFNKSNYPKVTISISLDGPQICHYLW